MSKKILSAVLAIAMVVSLCASLFTVSTSAASDYEADRAALQELIKELFVKGPSVSSKTLGYLIATGVVTRTDSAERAEVFGDVMKYDGNINPNYNAETQPLNDYVEVKLGYFVQDVDAFDQVAYDAMMEEAASAYYFSQNADLDKVDPSFNEGRNAIVKAQIETLEKAIAFLLAEVGAYNDKPDLYEEEYKAWREKFHQNGQYNPNYGINPFKEDWFNSSTNWENILQGYAGFPGWFTFDELRADATLAKLLNNFERLYRAAQTAKVEGKWYYDFVKEEVADLEKAWDAIVEALLADFKWNTPVTGTAAEHIKGYNNLVKVIEFYDTYIVDAYLNIYTATSQELLTNVLIAKQLVEFVKDTEGNPRVLFIAAVGADYFNNLKDVIISGIAALNPADATLSLTNDEIDAGVELINEANALLNGYSALKILTSYKDTYANLQTAVENLKVMLPYDANSYASYTVAANTSAGVKDLDGKTVVKENDKFVINFVPNYFAYARYYLALEEAIEAMAKAIDSYNANLESLDSVTSSVALDKAVLLKTLMEYDYLLGWNFGWQKDTEAYGNIEVYYAAGLYLYEGKWYVDNQYYYFNEVSDKYVPKFYEEIVRLANDGEVSNDDAARGQYDMFVAMFKAAVDVLVNGAERVAQYPFYEDIKFDDSNWDWETGEFTAEVNGYAKVAERLVAFLPYLIAQVEEIVNLYAYISDTLYNHFTDMAFADNAFAKDIAEEMAEAYEKLFSITEGYIYVNGDDVQLPLVTVPTLNALYNAFIDAYKALLTDRGDALVDNFVAEVVEWANSNYSVHATDAELYEKLQALKMEKALQLPVDAAEPYLYYDLTLQYVAKDSTSTANKYYMGDSVNLYDSAMQLNPVYNGFKDNIYVPLNKLSSLAEFNVSGYDKAWVSDMTATREKAGHILNSFVSAGSFLQAFATVTTANNVTVKKDSWVHDHGVYPYAIDEDGYMYFVNVQTGEPLQYMKKDGSWGICYWHPDKLDITKCTAGCHTNNTGDWDCYMHWPDAVSVTEMGYTGSLDHSDHPSCVESWIEGYYTSLGLTYEVAHTDNGKDTAIGLSGVNSDIPLSVVLDVIAEIDELLDTADEHTVEAVAAFKAAELEPAIEAASGKSMYDYAVDTEMGKTAWKAYEKAYTEALKAKYDARICTVDIAAIVDALDAAVEALNAVAKEETGATAADLEAAIADATALLAKADELDTEEKVAAVEALKAAIDDAKAFIAELRYNTTYISYDISEEIAAVEAAMAKVDEELTFADDLAAFLTYTAGLVEEVKGSESAYAAFVAAFEAATAVAGNEDLKASEYAAAANSVLAAYEALVASEPEFSKTYEAAVAKLAELKAVVTDGYTAESVAAFEAAVAALEAGINEVADDDALIELIANAYIAKADLAVKNVETCDD